MILKNFAGIIHSASAIAAYSIALDTVVGGLGRAKLSIIISDHHEAISEAIAETLKRGVTLLSAQGWYTKNDRTAILCVVKRTELYALKSLVRSIDTGAFLIISDAAQVLCDGFEHEP